jgi:PmbA protein
MKQKKEYMDLALYAAELAKKTGADAAETYVTDSNEVTIDVSNREVELANSSSDAGIGIRILKDQRMAFGTSNDLSKSSIKEMISDLIKKVPFHTPDEFNVIPGKEFGVLDGDWSGYTDLLSYDPKIESVPVQEKIKRAILIESSALDYGPKVAGAMQVRYLDQESYSYLSNSNGIAGSFPTSGCGGFASIRAVDGEDNQSGTQIVIKVKYDEFDPVWLGKRAAENAVSMLGAKPIKSCEVPMVVSPEVGAQLFEYIVGMLDADLVQKGKSLFADRIGEKVAADVFTLIDDGRLKGGLSTNPVDREGIPRQTTPLIVDGVLKTYLYDCYTANKGKTRSTGNRVGGSYQSRGGIGSTNLCFPKGEIKPEEILEGIKDGFYITVAFGLHAGIDDISGDFSIPVAGFKIEQGQKTFPIRGINIGGNLFDFLKSIDKVGDDLIWSQSVGCPTFSVESIKIGG